MGLSVVFEEKAAPAGLTGLVVRKVDDAVAEAVLAEVPVEGQEGIQPLALDQREGCAIREAEILVGMTKEDPFGLALDRGRDPEDGDAGRLEEPEELRGVRVARPGAHERARLVHDEVGGEELRSDGFETVRNLLGGGVKRVVAVHDSEEPPAVDEDPQWAVFFQP